MNNKEKFITVATTHIKRQGITNLLEWLENTDFYTAPASTKYHLATEGGLLQHSLNVYDKLLRLYASEYGAISEEAHETLAIIGLFHDICKVNCYTKSWKNVKVYSENGNKSDEAGRFDWESQPYYFYDDKFPFGYHGPKSAFLIERVIRLTTEEYICIANHMGAYDRSPNDYTLSGVFEKFNLAFLLHTADGLATISEKSGIKI
ncbi:MAG: HD domain-containing protein [Oscillospiraceae bacterium]|nr:HD domain-containing protein [Oscillospiraceae bacterium]